MKGGNMTRFLGAILLVLVGLARADAGGEKAGVFDYYVMSLSWSPSWCALTGDARGEDQCDPRHDYGFTLHGLWPQFEHGWPSFCPTIERAPSRQMTRDMADIMGSDGLAWHQWDKHGRCTGLSADGYYSAARAAYGKVTRPDILRRMTKAMALPAKVVEAAFLAENPDLKADMVTVTCERGYFQEVRICLTKDLEPRLCGPDAARDCLQRVMLPPVR
jgi:ribonuclease T2